jgi:DNA-binding CsgD family transcriptional regulator
MINFVRLSKLAHSTIINLHEARTTRELAPALFKFVAAALPQEVLFLVLRPLEFELRSFCSQPKFQQICDDYISGAHKDDIWLQRSPKDPGTPVVRHSLYTPQADLRRSRFYAQVMKKIGCEYGASLVAWRQGTWLGNLTIFRTKKQGDFRDDELSIMNACHLHFQSAINRIAILNEENLGNHSLEALIWTLPTAAVVLDWNLKLLYWNASSQELIAEWKKGVRMATKRSRPLSVPGEIVAAIERERQSLAKARLNSPGSPNMVPLLKVEHSKAKELSAKVSFLPSKSLAVSKGTFLLVFHRHQDIPDERDSYDRLAGLTRREREVALLASVGKNSAEIAKKLGTSGITVRTQLHKAYQKLGINSRYQLMTMFAKNPLVGVTR